VASNRVQLRGSNVLLTGATGGIGHAIARALAQRGAGLILTGRRREPLEALAQELSARTIVCDLDDRAEVASLAAAALDARVDVLVANAALPASGVLVEFTQAQIDRVLEVNLRAPIVLARELAPMMIERGSGHMVFMSSLSGKAASPASAMYSATKFGLRGFALSTRADLRPHGVGASVILPGFVRDAGMFADADVTLPAGVGTSSPEDVAAAVVRSIDRNRAEVEVAPLSLRAGASFASLVPGPAAVVSRWLGSDRVAADMAKGQSDKR
jgi:short-subunit dehydrogenase